MAKNLVHIGENQELRKLHDSLLAAQRREERARRNKAQRYAPIPSLQNSKIVAMVRKQEDK